MTEDKLQVVGIKAAVWALAIGATGFGAACYLLGKGLACDTFSEAFPWILCAVFCGVVTGFALRLIDTEQAVIRFARQAAATPPQPQEKASPQLEWKPVPELQAPSQIDIANLSTEMIDNSDGRGAYCVPLWKMQKLIAIYPETSRTACNSASILTGDYGTDHQRLIGAAIYYGWLKKEIPNGKTGQGREADWVISPMEARRQFSALVTEAMMRSRRVIADIQAPHSPR